MARRVEWTEAAWGDLEQIGDYIAADSPHYAASFVRRVRNVARSLADFAERGPAVPEFGDAAIRELIVGNYRLVYKISRNTVTVLAVIHGARDLVSFWREQPR